MQISSVTELPPMFIHKISDIQKLVDTFRGYVSRQKIIPGRRQFPNVKMITARFPPMSE